MSVDADRAARWVYAAAAALAGVLLVWMTHRVTFVNDEWQWIEERYQGGVHSLLRAHNDQLMAAPLLAFKIVMHTAGLSHHGPYNWVMIAMHLACITGAWFLVRARAGEIVATFVAVPLLVLGAAWESVLWAASMDFVFATAGMIAAWLALDRRTRAGDVLACAALVFTTLSFSGCVPLVLGVGLELILLRRKRDLWIVAAPLAIFAVWYVGYGGAGSLTIDTLSRTPEWFVQIGANTFGGLVGERSDVGMPLFVVAMVGLVWHASRAPLSPRLAGALLAVAGYWVLSGAARAVSDPATGNYVRLVYTGAVLLAVAGAELLDGRVLSRRLLLVGLVVSVASFAGNLGLLRQGQVAFDGLSSQIRADVTALELQGKRAKPDYSPSPGLAPIYAARYFTVVKLAGSSPAESPRALTHETDFARGQADRVLRELGMTDRKQATPAGAPPALIPAKDSTGAVRPSGAHCVAVEPGQATLRLRGPGAAIRVDAAARGPVGVRLWRFASEPPPVDTETLPAGTRLAVQVAPDAAPQPWRATILAPAGAEVCTAAPWVA